MSETTDTGRDLLERRARELAKPMGVIASGDAVRDANISSMLVVRIGAERVGIALDHITEVHRATMLTPIPGARPPIVGVIAWRGRVLTLIDTAQDRRGPLAITDTTRILIIGKRRAFFGIVADEVEDVQEIDLHDAAPVDDVAPDRRELVRGVTADAVVVLDAAALIARFTSTQ